MTIENASINTDRLEQLTQDLIDIYSPSGKEREVLRFLDKYLMRHGLPVQRVAVEADRYNVVIPGDGEEPQVLFIGHIDTVSAFDLDNYSYTREDDIVYGLGATDMKGACAAMIEAFIAFVRTHGRVPPVTLALVVGEEETGDGAAALVNEHRAPWALVGEPTGMVPCLGHYGYVELELKSAGVRAHASMAQAEHNAVNVMLKSLLDITGYVQKTYPAAIYNIRDVNSSEAGFAVPDRCTASIDIHLPPDAPVGTVLVALEERMLDLRKSSERIECNFSTVDGGYELPERGYLPDILQDVFSSTGRTWKTSHFRSHSDANQLWSAGIKPIVLGPGSLAQAHTEHESVSFSQLVDAAGMYYRILEAVDRGGE
jgi:acetylornithine deacetylase